MKLICLGDRHTVEMMRISGVEGYVVEKASDAEDRLNRAFSDRNTGLVFVSSSVMKMIPRLIQEKRVSNRPPLILQIPSPDSAAGDYSIESVIQKVVGIRV